MTPRDPHAPEPVIDLDAHRRQRVPTLTADALDRLAADAIATDLRSITAAALDAALHAMFGLPVGGVVVSEVRGEERVRAMLPTLELDAAAVGRLAAFAASLKAGEKPLSRHARLVAVCLDGAWQTVEGIAHAAGLDTADTRRALNELARRGLAQHVGDEWRRA
jgi:hypothetical protein